ncbi:hypothetical protein TNCV_1612731 [Trichonephila clavipes]|nr:hypothetical protein TNCV_1612731 [Trichonephila clavipes]
MVANLVSKNDANLALSERFRQVSFESPLRLGTIVDTQDDKSTQKLRRRDTPAIRDLFLPKGNLSPQENQTDDLIERLKSISKESVIFDSMEIDVGMNECLPTSDE